MVTQPSNQRATLRQRIVLPNAVGETIIDRKRAKSPLLQAAPKPMTKEKLAWFRAVGEMLRKRAQ